MDELKVPRQTDLDKKLEELIDKSDGLKVLHQKNPDKKLKEVIDKLDKLKVPRQTDLDKKLKEFIDKNEFFIDEWAVLKASKLKKFGFDNLDIIRRDTEIKGLYGYEIELLNLHAKIYTDWLLQKAGLAVDKKQSADKAVEKLREEAVSLAVDYWSADSDYLTKTILMFHKEYGLELEVATAAATMLAAEMAKPENQGRTIRFAKVDEGKFKFEKDTATKKGDWIVDPRWFINDYHALAQKRHVGKADKEGLSYYSSEVMGDYILRAMKKICGKSNNNVWAMRNVQKNIKKMTQPMTVFRRFRVTKEFNDTGKSGTLSMELTTQNVFGSTKQLVKSLMQEYRATDGKIPLATLLDNQIANMTRDTISSVFNEMYCNGNLYPFLALIKPLVKEMDAYLSQHFGSDPCAIFNKGSFPNEPEDWDYELDMARNANQKIEQVFGQIMDAVLSKWDAQLASGQNANGQVLTQEARAELEQNWDMLACVGSMGLNMIEKSDSAATSTWDKDFTPYNNYPELFTLAWRPRPNGRILNTNIMNNQASQTMRWKRGQNNIQMGGYVDMTGFNYVGAFFQGWGLGMMAVPDQGCDNMHLQKGHIYYRSMARMSVEIGMPPSAAPPKLRPKVMMDILPSLAAAGVMSGASLGVQLLSMAIPALSMAAGFAALLPSLAIPLIGGIVTWNLVNNWRVRAGQKAKTREIYAQNYMPSIFRRNINIVPIQSMVEDARSQAEQVKARNFYSRQHFSITGGAVAEADWLTQFNQMDRWFGGDDELSDTEASDRIYYQRYIDMYKLPNEVYNNRREHFEYATRNTQFPNAALFNLRFSFLNMLVPLLSITALMMPFMPSSFVTSMFGFSGTILSQLLSLIFPGAAMLATIVVVGVLSLWHYYGIQWQIRRQYYEQDGINKYAADIAEARANMNNGRMMPRLKNVMTSCAKGVFEITKPVDIPEYKHTEDMYFLKPKYRLDRITDYINYKNGIADKNGHVDTWRDLMAKRISRTIDNVQRRSPKWAFRAYAASIGVSVGSAIGMGMFLTMWPILLCNVVVLAFSYINKIKQYNNIQNYVHTGLVGVTPVDEYKTFEKDYFKDRPW
ncbi:hypothetical protein NO2_1426 [Candidatus Termititenax persephonae]|uniref:Uncharacterized protein n=1 Tax=Candidatus Termititenax persephonae TaxID=2218525 RepID=A0A388TKD9_9BACT|nr:hypothetical protein NO2_1426 [Candidatus Termititenax persephonae]